MKPEEHEPASYTYSDRVLYYLVQRGLDASSSSCSRAHAAHDLEQLEPFRGQQLVRDALGHVTEIVAQDAEHERALRPRGEGGGHGHLSVDPLGTNKITNRCGRYGAYPGHP